MSNLRALSKGVRVSIIPQYVTQQLLESERKPKLAANLHISQHKRARFHPRLIWRYTRVCTFQQLRAAHLEKLGYCYTRCVLFSPAVQRKEIKGNYKFRMTWNLIINDSKWDRLRGGQVSVFWDYFWPCFSFLCFWGNMTCCNPKVWSTKSKCGAKLTSVNRL